MRFEILPGITFADGGDFFRRALRDDSTAAIAAFRSQVDDVISNLDDVQIVLDHDDGIAGIRQFLQHVDQFSDIHRVQAGRWLVKDV